MINLGRYALTGHVIFLTVLLLKFSQIQPVKAQVIAPATDGTGTTVNQRGQSFNIETGSLSADGDNLFHSFQTFQLTNGYTANFLANPSIQRIFARITGNGAAFIDGNLKITGAQADLFLLNPSGVIFGPNASLNLSADLTVTTGNRINFNDGVFKAIGTNDYDILVGSPTAFTFDQPGTIRNQGDLVLLPGQSLTLLGGNVVNTGSLKAEEIQIVEVSDGQIIQISQMGSLINLEFSANTLQNSSTNSNLTASMLPSLLTNGELEHADQITTNSDGQVLLTDSSLSTSLTEDPLLSTQTSQSEIIESTDADIDLTFQQSGIASDSDQTTETQLRTNKITNNQPRDRTDTADNSQNTQTRASTDTTDNSQNTPSSDGQADETQTNRPPSHRPKVQHHVHRAVLNTVHANDTLEEVEELRSQEFSDYFGRDLGAKDLTLSEIQQLLTQVNTQTGNQSVIVYVKTPKLATDIFEPTSTNLELLIFKPTGALVSLVIPDVTQADLSQTVEQFRRALISSSRVGSKRYLPTAKILYQWLIQPIEDELGADAIDTILFSMDSGLRTVPIAALHDGEQFLIEKYGVGMIPSLGLMDPNYQPLENAQVLAMGASEFAALQPLPAVPAEIETIGQLWPSRKFLNETFTQQNLINQQQHIPAQIIHLATHAEFSAGNAEESYIQLWNEQLSLKDIHTLGWDRPTVELLVLSACRTALGDTNAEMGFAGLAVAAGVKSALASLWTVSDVGTLALMSEFYHQLMDTQVKSDALRAAQLAMIKGETHLEEKQLPIADSQLPVELQDNLEYLDLSHPYYWAGFTLIGSPW